MTKKDRTAIVVTVLAALLSLLATLPGLFLWALGAAGYWGYRFVKGDISFLKMRNLD